MRQPTKTYPATVAAFGISAEADAALDALAELTGTSRTHMVRAALVDRLREAGLLLGHTPEPSPAGVRRNYREDTK